MVTAAGLLASLTFTAVVFFDLAEGPVELVDSELYNHAQFVLTGLNLTKTSLVIPDATRFWLDRLYWIKVFDDQQKLIYSSDMVQLLDLPLYQKNIGYTINSSILKTTVMPEPDDDDDDLDRIDFRVRVFSLQGATGIYTVQIARPMEKVDNEIRELLITLLLGFFGSAIVLIFIGYFVAGQILKPINAINKTAGEINDKTLDKRIPLGKSHDEIFELSSSLNTMFDRLQYSFKKQKEFIANASHELKTPITMLRLFFDDFLQHEDIPVSLKQKLIQQNKTLYRMNRLVKNLLDLSTLELNKSYQPVQFDLAELAMEIFDEFTVIFETNTIKLSIDLPKNVPVYADQEKMRRVFINIVDNAIKYNLENDGEIRFQITVEEGNCVIDLYNTGTGVPQDELSCIFEQFHRVERSRSIAYGGSGLGLTIVKQIIELHGGEIEMKSKANSWARILISLPICK